MRKIAILGGSFDPITNAHIKIAEEISAKFNCEIMILPARLSKWKECLPASKEDRLAMIELAFKNYKNIFVETIEIDQDELRENSTIDTMMQLIDKYPNTEFYYIIGTDQLINLPRWSNIEELIRIVKFIVIEREGYEKDQELMEHYECIDSNIKLDNISSTSIRNFKSKDAPKEILDYILRKGLYLENKLKDNLTERRLLHTISVADLAKELAIDNNLDSDKAYIAGLMHDCAKDIRYEKQVELMLKYEPCHISENRVLYHQYLAPIIAKEEYGIKDKDILHAIKYHTTTTYPYSRFDKLIYLADKCERNRNYDSSFYINKAKKDIDLGFAYFLLDNIEYLKEKHPDELFYHDPRLLKEVNEILDKERKNGLLKLLDEHYGYNIVVYDISSINPIAKTSIVVSCASERQLIALANSIEDYFIDNHFYYHHTEKGKNSGWVLVDCGDIVINLFKIDSRNDYNLDELYKDLPHQEYKGEENGKL